MSDKSNQSLLTSTIENGISPLATALHQRIDSMKEIVNRRSFFMSERITDDDGIMNVAMSNIAHDGEIDDVRSHEGETGETPDKVRPLAKHDPKLQTDAGKRLEAILDKYVHEVNEEGKSGRIRSSRKQRGRGLSRIEVKRGERRKISIKALKSELQKNCKRYLSRGVSSVHFQLNTKESSSQLDGDEYVYPIPVRKSEMNPHLLLTLSCEMIALNRGNRLLKVVALHEKSQKLFVLMYWFIHCRFFQMNSIAEQRHLLGSLANLYPGFIKMLREVVPTKEQDTIFRIYPFVLSKAVFLGFKYLCPGNHNLFKGAFQRILNLSVFRLFTGLDDCPGSTDALRLQLYPGDGNEEEGGSHTHDFKANRLKPLPPTTANQRTRRPQTPALVSPLPLNSNDTNINQTIDNKDQQPPESPRNIHIRRSMIKFTGDRESLRFRKDKPESLGAKILPRQPQSQFDAYQISPLLTQYLGRETISTGPKHFIKRTDPVRYCKNGGEETYCSRQQSKRCVMVGTGTCASSYSQMDGLKRYHSNAQQLKRKLIKEKLDAKKHLKALALERDDILRSGKASIDLFAASIMSN